MDYDVIVVGAGISGLSAAYRIQNQGYKVLVLEKSSTVGGRTQTYCYENVCVDLSAQFLASFYKDTFKLLDELGIENQKVQRPGKMAIVKGNKVYEQSPSGILFSDIIPFFEKLKLIWTFIIAKLNSEDLNADNLIKSIKFDNQSAAHYAKKHIGDVAAKNLVATMLRGSFYWKSDTTSNSFLMFLLRYLAGMKEYKLKDGIGTIADTLAEKIEVKTEHGVLSAEVDPSTGVWLVSANRPNEDSGQLETVSFTSKAVLSAVPAVHVNHLFPNLPDDLQQFFGNISYTHNATAHLFINGRLDLLPFSHLAYVPDDSPKIANVSLNGGFIVEKTPSNEDMSVLSIFPSSEFSEEIMDCPDDEIVDKVLAELVKVHPFKNFTVEEIKKMIAHAKIRHVRLALPCIPPGYIHNLKTYRDSLSKTLPPGLFVAGAYLGSPSIEGAILAGNLELPAIIRYLQQQPQEKREVETV